MKDVPFFVWNPVARKKKEYQDWREDVNNVEGLHEK